MQRSFGRKSRKAMMTESKVAIETEGAAQHILRYEKMNLVDKPADIGYACIVGDKSIRVFPNNKIEIWDLEYQRDDAEDADDFGLQAVTYTERLSWATEYPEWLSLDNVKASIDFAFMSSGLPSIFYRTNLFLMNLETFEEHRTASVKAFEKLYPGAEPVLTDMNFTLIRLGQDQFYSNRLES
jgi:hypothetical protein